VGEEIGSVEAAGPKKVAIVGFSQHRNEAPFADKGFEIWGLNDLHEQIPRWDRWFEMHGDNQIKDYCSRKQGKPYLEGLAGLKCDVWMQKVRPEVPNSKEYPIEEVKRIFGDYFTNSISYMIAMAIMENYKVIGVYGVDMAQDTEYAHQRPSCEYMICYARGKGIEVILPKTSDLLKSRWLYGYEEHQMDAWNLRVKEIYDGIVARKTQADQQIQQAQAASLQYAGAMDAVRTLQRIQVS